MCCVYQRGLTFEYLLTFHRSLGLKFGKYCSRFYEYQKPRSQLSLHLLWNGTIRSQRDTGSHVNLVAGTPDKTSFGTLYVPFVLRREKSCSGRRVRKSQLSFFWTVGFSVQVISFSSSQGLLEAQSQLCGLPAVNKWQVTGRQSASLALLWRLLHLFSFSSTKSFKKYFSLSSKATWSPFRSRAGWYPMFPIPRLNYLIDKLLLTCLRLLALGLINKVDTQLMHSHRHGES